MDIKLLSTILCNIKVKVIIKLLNMVQRSRVGLRIDIAVKFFLFIIRRQHIPYTKVLNIIIIIQIILSNSIYFLFLNKLQFNNTILNYK